MALLCSIMGVSGCKLTRRASGRDSLLQRGAVQYGAVHDVVKEHCCHGAGVEGGDERLSGLESLVDGSEDSDSGGVVQDGDDIRSGGLKGTDETSELGSGGSRDQVFGNREDLGNDVDIAEITGWSGWSMRACFSSL